jgi:hypothetical protein
VIEIVERSFHPKVEMMENPLVRVNFIPIKNGGKVVPGKWVIRIVVERGNELYVCMDNGCFLGYKRMDGRKVTLRDKELYDEIVRYA